MKRLLTAFALLALLAGSAQATIWDWSTTAGSNGNSDATINYQEGQAPSSLNDSARAAMAVIAKWRNDISGVLNTTGGTANAQTLTSNGSAAALVNGWEVCGLIGAGLSNTGATTLNVDSLGAKAVQSTLGSALVGGEITANSVQCFVYDTAQTAWIIKTTGSQRPIGGGLELNGGTGAIQRSALTGDVTASAASNSTTIAAGVVTGSKIANATVAGSNMINNTVTATQLAQLAGVSVLGNSTNATANMAAITAAADNTVLKRSAGALTFGSVALGTDVSGTLLAAQEPAHTGDVTNSAGSLAMTIGANVVTNAKIAQAGANTMKGNWSGVTANDADNAMPTCNDTGGNHLNYVAGTGIICGTSVSSFQNLVSASTSIPIGFTTGAGCSVTQITSKATGVTCNGLSGQITMNNANLAGGGRVNFAVSDTSIAATDTVIISQSTNFEYYLYQAFNIGAGSFSIMLNNAAGGNASDAVKLNFVIIKGANS